jgi:hypothetical protein
MSNPINENEFFGAQAGTNGTVNYQAPVGTHASPNVSQNPSHFDSSKNNTVDGQTTDSGSMQKNLDALYAKKDVPSPDEVASGLKYELSNMTKKDKALAKEKVLTNLRKDPHYYGKLNHLNIDDKTMDMSPQAATDKIFQDIAEQRGTKKFAVNKGISDIIAEMRQKKKDRSAWKTDPKK